jgi:hypothetical protein
MRRVRQEILVQRLPEQHLGAFETDLALRHFVHFQDHEGQDVSTSTRPKYMNYKLFNDLPKWHICCSEIPVRQWVA